MSLTVYLNERKKEKCPHCNEIIEGACLFAYNITHNLGEMAAACGLYYPLWRPEEIGIEQAKYLIPLLEQGIKNLENHKEFYRQFEPENKWGTLEGLIKFFFLYLDACKSNPDSYITTCR